MIPHKKTLFGGCLFILLTVSSSSMAQYYQNNYSQESRQNVDPNYYPNYQGYQRQDIQQTIEPPQPVQKTEHQGAYYSQNYQPSKQILPAGKYQSPAELLKDSINKVIYFLNQPKNNVSVDQMTAFLQSEIAPHFDFKYMARWVAGRYSKTMSPDQQRQFTENFSELFVTTFVKKLTHYQNYPPVVESFRSKRVNETEAVVTANVLQEKGTRIKIDFKFLKTQTGWKVIDVRGNGISALYYYRNYFADQMKQRRQQQSVFN
ncbi:MAG: ABC transporter substrate-binding protein [Bacteroidales bacterium]|nr:ABC transporter substrate-binding protein [Bacteroidales bacterium]